MTQRSDVRDVIERALESSSAIGDELSIEHCLRVLTAPRRVAALECLVTADAPLSVETLVRTIRSEYDVEDPQPKLTTILYHCDLPMLVDAGLVSFESGTDQVEPTNIASEIAADFPDLSGERT